MIKSIKSKLRPVKNGVLSVTDYLNWSICPLRYGKPMTSFSIIGAQKAATTSLHHYLVQHPELFMGTFKETNFFLPDSDEKNAYFDEEPYFLAVVIVRSVGGYRMSRF